MLYLFCFYSCYNINNRQGIEQVKLETPPLLRARNLQINQGKTEEYSISVGGNDAWKTCRYLGTLLDSDSDILRQKQLAYGAMNKIKPIIEDRHLRLEIKVRAFNAYVTSVFPYNSETWTLTKAGTQTVDIFHRRLLKKTLNIRYPNIISNDELYRKTAEIPWGVRIESRRLRFLGHLLRLPEATPVRQALNEFQLPHRRPVGAPKQTWLKIVNKNLKSRGVDNPRCPPASPIP